MATFRLVTVIVHTPPAISDIVANDEISVYWDDSTSTITTTKNGVSWTGTSASYLGEFNTNYTMVNGITSYEGEYAVSGYSYCSGTDLKWFKMLMMYAPYPYMVQQTTANSPVCATGGGAVCDISFSGPPVITHSTDQTTGGSITVTATSSNGTVKYGLRNYTYAEMTNTSGTFSGLPPGNWTVYAKDANDCTAVLNFKILFKPTEAEHYRFSWMTVPIGQGTSYDARLRIYEREYVGDLVEIDRGDESPFRLNKPRVQGHLNDKFFPIHPTSAVLSLYSQQDYQFLPLFTQDNKKFRCVYEINETGTWTEVWQGFIVPSVYREDFISVPYTVEIQITDNVRTLEQELFTDDDGNLLNGSMKLIKVINHVMKRTGLNLKIRSGINIFETNHTTTATSDPLDQTYVDVACYRDGTDPFTCWEVLESVLRPFGARIVLSDNQWLLEEIDRAHEGYAYRVFDTSGNYESNGTASATDITIEVKGSTYTDRAAMVDEDHSLEVIPAYGKITVRNALNYVGSLITGGFEKKDLLSPESEEESSNPGIFVSEEGFKDWTLRLNGTGGVSFGRSVVLSDDNSLAIRRLIDTKRPTTEDIARSVGTFYFTPGSWSGNLRNAYIESAPKPYQYGPGGELKFSFEYSVPSSTENIPFMPLRFALKVGSNFLQEDGSWSTAEGIYRAYPTPSTKLQKFEMFVTLPEVSVTTDTTIQVRIYYYSPHFYDHGSPSATSSPADGTNGLASLRAQSTTGIDYDYRLDYRYHTTLGVENIYARHFAEIRYSTAADDALAGIIRPNDFDSSTNPKIWQTFQFVFELNKTLNEDSVTVRDTIFYIDNVDIDALVNGQEPPRDETRELKISKYINETLEVDLYNADMPSIVNARNMYNNYFRLSDGTPTTLWARSGITEFLPLRDILLKVLGANHSAPTFKITGTFINEFQRIGFRNYLKIIKPGSAMYPTNTTFATDLSNWTQTGLGTAFTWNSGAEVALSGAVNSQKIYQEVSHRGGYIEIDVEVQISSVSSGNTREDVLWVLFYNGSSIVHTEKMKTYPALTSTSSLTFSHIAFAPSNITRIGFFFQYISGSGDCTYVVKQFNPQGTDIEEIYQITDYQSNERLNEYSFELMQQSKSFISLSGIDTGGNNQSGGTTGREHSSAYSSAYS